MKLIKTEDAVGHVLCHDITQIVKDVKKDAVFRKGHIVTEADIPLLLSIGKENLYVWEQDETMLHEDSAAEILRDICIGPGMHATDPKEGKIDLIADCNGLLKINRPHLLSVNRLGEMMIASRHGDTAVKTGDKIAGMRVIPLVIEKQKMEAVKAFTGIFEIKPFLKKRAAIITTGSEVYKGRITDTFTPVVEGKLTEFGVEIIGKRLCSDDPEMITAAIKEFLSQGADLILCTGGMSVDPDDKTPLAIKNTGAQIISYGAPVLPGAMFLLAYDESGVPIMGLPGCVMYAKRTIFDLVLPRIMADERITAEILAEFGEGGLCLNCDICTYPNCGFGK